MQKKDDKVGNKTANKERKEGKKESERESSKQIRQKSPNLGFCTCVNRKTKKLFNYIILVGNMPCFLQNSFLSILML